MADTQLPEPQPGDPKWTHPDVKGMTDPVAIKALTDAITAQEKREHDRVKGFAPESE